MSINVNNKKCAPKLIFFNEIFFRKIWTFFDIENWLWMSKLCHLSIIDIKKTFCNVWFFCKNEACVNCGTLNATTLIWLVVGSRMKQAKYSTHCFKMNSFVASSSLNFCLELKLSLSVFEGLTLCLHFYDLKKYPGWIFYVQVLQSVIDPSCLSYWVSVLILRWMDMVKIQIKKTMSNFIILFF